MLASAPLFKPLDRRQRLDLARRFAAHDVAPDVTIIEEGADGQGLYVVLSGGVDVSKRDGESKILLASLGPGEVFGEMALLNEEPASATVTTNAQATVLFLAREVFARLIEAVPEIGDYVRELGEARAMDTRLLVDTLDDGDVITDDELIFI